MVKLVRFIIKAILVVLVVTITVSSFFGCSKEQVPQDLRLIARVEYKGKIHEAKVSFTEQRVYTFSDNNLIASNEAVVHNGEEDSIMQLGDYDNVESNDITEDKAYVSNSVWKANLEGSKQQLKYYDEQGYDEIFRGETEKFIEVYMKKGKNMKRILITEDKIGIVDTDYDVNFSSMDEYVSYVIGGNN